jgi:hypothetical protein
VVDAFFARDDETFDAGLEVFPLLADLVGFVGDDARGCFGRLGDGVEQFGEVAHHVAGFAEDGFVETLAEFEVGVGDEEAAGLVAEPADEADVLGEGVHLADAIQGVLGAALVGIFAVGGGLAPLVDQRLGNPQRRGDCLDAGFVHRLLNHVVGFHRRRL